MALSSVHFPFMLANTLHFRHGKTTCGDQESTNLTSPDFHPLGSSPYSKIWIIQWWQVPFPHIHKHHPFKAFWQWSQSMAGWVRRLPQSPSSQERFCNSSLGQKAADQIGLSLWLASVRTRAWDFRPICSPGAPDLQLCVGRCGTRRKMSRSCMYSQYATLVVCTKSWENYTFSLFVDRRDYLKSLP